MFKSHRQPCRWEKSMKRNVLIAVSMAALALASCGKKTETTANDSGVVASGSMANSVVAEVPAITAGQQFANTAAASDAFEIESSKLAAINAASAATKSFAQAMVKGHTDSTAKLKAAASAASPAIVPDPTFSSEQLQTLEELKGKKGAAFDTAYGEAQSNAHEMTLEALRAYSATGDVQSLKAFATTMVPIVTAHLNMAKGL